VFTDADAAGREAAEKIVHQLYRFFPVFLMRCPFRRVVDENGDVHENPMDPGEMSSEQIGKAYDQAEIVLDEIVW
jgi:hypothetical protein